MDAKYIDAVKREDEDTLQRMVQNFAKMQEYDVGPAEHRTSSENFNVFDLAKAGSSGGGRIDFYRPAVYFAIASERTKEIQKSLKEKGYPAPYGKNVIKAYLKIDSDKDFYQKEPNGTEIFGITDINRIKSADSITYDDNDEIIPLSQRFDLSNDDIRY